MNLQHFVPPFLVGYADFYFPVKPSRSTQRRVKRAWTVSCADNYDVSSSAQPIHQSQKLRDDASFNFASDFFPFRRYRVELIDEYYAWSVLLGLLKNLTQPRFRFSVEFAHDFWAVDGVEVRFRLVRDRSGKQRFAASRRTMKQYAFWRFYSQALEKFRVPQRQLHHLADALDFFV
jgi:hypothetical protein